MATVKCINSKASLKRAIEYITKEEKGKTIFVKDCTPQKAAFQMMMIKNIFNKKNGRTYYHFTISFHKDEKITEKEVKDFTTEFIKRSGKFDKYQIIGAVHTDREHLHSHFIVNSVSVEGKKYHQTKKEYQELKDICNKMCKEKGLAINEKGKTFDGQAREETSAYNKDTYQLLKKAEQGEVKSYVQNIALAVLDCKEKAISREEFILQMNEMGYGVDWQDNHKYITFTDLDRQKKGEKQCKVRNNKLEQYYNIGFGKEALENEFESNSRARETKEVGADAFIRELDTTRRVTEIERNAHYAEQERLATERGTERKREAEKREEISSERDFSERNDFVGNFGRTFGIERTTKQSNRTESCKYEKDEELEL